MKTALVLTGGGSKGAVEVGVLKQITKKVVPDVVIGTSVGALNAAGYLDGPDFEDNIQRLEQQWLSIKRKNVFPLNKKIMYKFAGVQSLFTNRGLKSLIDKSLKAKDFESLQRKLYVNCTGLDDGKSHYFSRGRLDNAILASCALLPYFEPVKIGDHFYVDGGHSNYLGLRKIEELKCDQVIVVNLAYHKMSRDIKGVIGYTYYVNEIVKRQMISEAIKGFNTPNLIAISPVIPEKLHMTNFSYTEKLIKLGEREAKKHLGKIKK